MDTQQHATQSTQRGLLGRFFFVVFPAFVLMLGKMAWSLLSLCFDAFGAVLSNGVTVSSAEEEMSSEERTGRAVEGPAYVRGDGC